VYTIDPKEHLMAELAAEKDGYDVIGSAHSHTHSEAYPSPTDVAQAPDPAWHYVIVSLATGKAAPRSFRIVDSHITEETIVSA
jgi:proteasome lid subunit RPN8/RPN11